MCHKIANIVRVMVQRAGWNERVLFGEINNYADPYGYISFHRDLELKIVFGFRFGDLAMPLAFALFHNMRLVGNRCIRPFQPLFPCCQGIFILCPKYQPVCVRILDHAEFCTLTCYGGTSAGFVPNICKKNIVPKGEEAGATEARKSETKTLILDIKARASVVIQETRALLPATTISRVQFVTELQKAGKKPETIFMRRRPLQRQNKKL
jgi:hypothetical protein